MSRNEIFLFLACAFATAIMASPLPSSRSSRMTVVSLLSPTDLGSFAESPTFQPRFADR